MAPNDHGITHAHTDDERLQELRERWSPDWRIWRSRNDFRMPASWCATYRARQGELGQTVIESTPEELETALRKARTGPRPELEPAMDDVYF